MDSTRPLMCPAVVSGTNTLAADIDVGLLLIRFVSPADQHITQVLDWIEIWGIWSVATVIHIQ